MKQNFMRASIAALSAAMLTATMAVPAFAAPPDDLYTVQDGGTTSYGDEFGHYVDYDRDYYEAATRKPEKESHVVSYYMRTGDEGSLEFDWARVEGRSTLGGANVPGVTLPDGWYLDGYYVNGERYTAGELAGYLLSTPTLEVEVRTYPSGQNSGKDDRNERYAITYKIRSGNKGELVFETTTVTGYGNKIPYANIPTLTSRFASGYSISGYYVDGVKYSRSELAKMPITGDVDVEVRTYRDTGSDNTGWDDDEDSYEWSYDLGTGYKACGCQYDCSHASVYEYGGDIQYSVYGGIYAGGYYYPPAASAYPYISSYAISPIGQATVTFDPQNGQSCFTTSVWRGGRLAQPGNPTCTGYTFLGWSTSKNGITGYWKFDQDTVNTNLVLYGIWRKDAASTVKTNGAADPGTVTTINTNTKGYCTVTLQPNNGVTFEPVAVKQGNTLRINGTPKCKGYTFVGWSTDKNGKEFWDFEKDVVKKDLTLYGVWEKTETTTNPMR